jgi:hypothetical protein
MPDHPMAAAVGTQIWVLCHYLGEILKPLIVHWGTTEKGLGAVIERPRTRAEQKRGPPVNLDLAGSPGIRHLANRQAIGASAASRAGL